jgi:tetratricopeptide (TPR) repeat protein
MIGRRSRFDWPGFVRRACLLVVFLPILGLPVLADIPDQQQPATDDVKSLFKQARKEDRQGRFDDAERLYRQIIGIDSHFTDAKLALAYLLAKKRQIRDAYDISFAVAQAEPTNSRAFAVLGVALLTGGNFSDARRCFDKSLSLNRKDDLAWAGQGLLDFYENRINDSLVKLEEAVFREPDEPDYFFVLGQISARAEHYKESADAYRRFLIIAPQLDKDRRDRIKGLINFLDFLGEKTALYATNGADQTSVPISVVGNRPVIKIRINGNDKPLNFVLDTGSGISVISDTTARRLKVREITHGGFAKGIGGDGKFEIVYGFLREVGLGTVKIRNVPVYIRHFQPGTEDIDGYIGLSLISKFLTTIDYGNLKFELAKRDDTVSAPANSDISLPLRLTSSGFLSGEVKLEGIDKNFNFIVDTGASVSVISDEIAGLQEVSRYVRTEKMRVIGSAGVTEDVPSFMLPRVTFGNNSRESVAAIALDLDIINEASGFQQAGILGGNFLRNYRLTFDFKNSKVIFVPIGQNK